MPFNDSFNPRSNSLNALRLLLATSVVVSHSWQIGGYGAQPSFGGVTLGVWGVYGFFAISGFLITRSRLSGRPVAGFYWARLLRIYPGFVVCIFLVAFVFAPVSAAISSGSSYNFSSGLSYFLRNIPLYAPVLSQEGIGNTLAAAPYAGVWNGPLWTLFFEAACYVLIGVAASLITRKLLPGAVAALFGGGTAVMLAHLTFGLPLPQLVDDTLPLVIAFLAGAVLFLCGDKVRLRPLTVIPAVAVLAAAGAFGLAPAFAGLPIAFLMLWLGNVLPLQRVGSTHDISYGIYIYGAPLQQMLYIAFPQAPLVVYIVLSLALVFVIAFLSSRFVEEPALRFKSRVPFGQSKVAVSA
ncbi:acyltransferase family protein [Arthrobacter sp.]|uniref:acyltransferase family protein n=1 Tax=Arthrobacter sp. TaxID=1667 RepID=UPI003393AF10